MAMFVCRGLCVSVYVFTCFCHRPRFVKHFVLNFRLGNPNLTSGAFSNKYFKCFLIGVKLRLHQGFFIISIMSSSFFYTPCLCESRLHIHPHLPAWFHLYGTVMLWWPLAQSETGLCCGCASVVSNGFTAYWQNAQSDCFARQHSKPGPSFSYYVLNNKNAHESIHLIPHSCLCLLTLNVYLLIGICIVFVAILGLDWV